MNTHIQQTIKHWGYLMPYAYIPQDEKEYKNLLAFFDELMEISRKEKDARVASLLRLISTNIEEYETHKYILEKLPSTEILKFLMEEHNLSQSDFPEIGSQSLISKLLNGDRKLTTEHIRYLARRFNVSPSVFF